jgi:hypothetical protein
MKEREIMRERWERDIMRERKMKERTRERKKERKQYVTEEASPDLTKNKKRSNWEQQKNEIQFGHTTTTKQILAKYSKTFTR